MELNKLDARSCTSEEIHKSLDEDGYVILTGLLDEIALKTLHEELEPHFGSRKNCQALFFGFNTKRIEAILKKSKIAQKMVMNETVLDAVEHVLGPNCDTFQLNLTQGIRINPGEDAQVLHPDSAMFPIEHKPFEFVVNALWAYSEFTHANGATRIVPGSHKWPADRLPEDHEILSAEMPAGSVLIYAASLLHGGGENISAKPRTGIAIGYCLGWLRQSENQYLTYPPEVAKEFTPELQQMVGYHVHRPNLGWVNGHDPIHLISGDKALSDGAEDFLTEEQKVFLKEYHKGKEDALTSHDYKIA